MKEQIIGWLAGFIDGEGCLTISKQIRTNRPTDQFRPLLTIANTFKPSLDIFHKRYGGTLRFNKEKRQSKSGVPWSDSWTWYCPMSKLRTVIEELLPYFIVKREQAVIMLMFLDHLKTLKRPKGGRNTDGTFKGSSPLSEKDIQLKELLRKKIQLLNSGNRFKK